MHNFVILFFSADPLTFYPMSVPIFSPWMLGYFVSSLFSTTRAELKLAEREETVITNSGEPSRTASMLPLLPSTMNIIVIISGLQTRVFAIAIFFLAVASVQNSCSSCELLFAYRFSYSNNVFDSETSVAGVDAGGFP